MSDSVEAVKTICLNMIVKNESHIIVETLKHLLSYMTFDYWVISDTGSTDNTRELIKDFFKEHGIPGELDETPWKDFGYNRTVAFERAYKKTDYVFVWDADDEIRGSFRIPEPLIADSYIFTFGNESGFRYSRCQLFNNHKKWKYVGVLHEYPACTETVGPPVNVRGDYYFVSGRKGARNKDPNKYLNDALVLEKAYEESVEEKNPNGRYVFYCAQSYNSANIFDKAIEWYKKTLATNTWIQEKYVSCLEIYSMYEQQGKGELGLSYLVESYKYCNTRIECIYRLIKYYCVNNIVDIAYMYYTLVQKYYENDYLTDEVSKHLFTKKEEYDFYLPYYMIIVAERCKKMDTMIQMYRMISKTRYLHAGQWWYTNLFTNLQFAVGAFPQDLELLSNLLSYVDALREKGIQFTTDHYKTLDNIITKVRPLLTALSVAPTFDKQKPVEIMFTVTTCKRFDLFEQTMNSILRNWTDLQSVDYFFCVDDNSSEEERTSMRTSYPFFDYYLKTPQEKGHRESMNIIWNKLQEIKPKYWIHLEDDWVYIRPENYVQRAKVALEKYENQNVHQIVFNRNYGILYPQMELVGGATLEPGLVKHEMKEIKVGRNCAYWPHYSLQPSMTRVSKILELGNYDSANSFFERDYANKYNAAGYKTGFFNSIYSIHIGKQHWEKEGKNAYALNETGQFSKNQNVIIKPKKKNQRLTGTMQQHLEAILQKIEEGTPFGLIRPSDGEYAILKGETLTNCDKWTFTSGGKLQKELLEAVQTVNPNLYIGIPCNTCNIKWNCTQTIYNDYINTFRVPLAQRTYANLFMNSNWALFTNFIKSYDKGIYMITSGKNESEIKILDRFLISPTLVNVWDTEGTAETERLLNFIKDKKGQLFCFSAGPLSKVWIPLCMKANPTNTYLDTGSALDCFTKGSINRIYYTNPSSEYSNMSCRFIEQKEQTQPNKNLVYCCVFYNKDYIELLKLLFASINVFSTTKTMDFVIFTSSDFRSLVENFTKKLPFHVKIHYFDFKTLFQAACARLFIYDYPGINQYEKFLYLDTDILVKGDLANIFQVNLEEKLYALEEGTIGMPNFGGQFFTEKDSKDSKNLNTPGMNSGVLLFKKCDIIKGLFQEIREHVTKHTEQGLPVPACADQPFINYHAITKNLCDNKMLSTYVHNLNSSERVVTSPKTYETQSICHFSWPIGNFYNKFSRMKTYLSDILKNYKSIIDNPINLINTLDVDNSKIVNKTYTWGKGKIKFEDNCKLYTTWVGGTYEIIDTYLVKASWSIYSHYLHFNKDYTEFISVREGDADVFHCFL
jgi:hypothetical protein